MPKQDGTVGGRGFLIPGLGSYKAAGKRALEIKRGDTASKEPKKLTKVRGSARPKKKEEPKLMKATRTRRKVLGQQKPAPAKSSGSKRYTRGSTDQALGAKRRTPKGGTRPKRNYGQMD